MSNTHPKALDKSQLNRFLNFKTISFRAESNRFSIEKLLARMKCFCFGF